MVRQTISKETSDTMRTLIKSVVTDGTAKNASVAGYSIGGKTGTSEKIDVFDENGHRVQDKIVSFVGIAPMGTRSILCLWHWTHRPGRQAFTFPAVSWQHPPWER